MSVFTATATSSSVVSMNYENKSTTLDPQGIIFGTLSAKQYGNESYTVSATGGASGNPVTFTSSDTNIATCTGTNGATITIVNAGSCFIYANQAGNATYSAADQVAQPLVINKAPLTITAESKAKNFDGTAYSPFTVKYYGFVHQDVYTSLVGTLSYSGTAISAVDVANGYVITPSGLTSDNYDITYINGVLDINKAPLTITAQNKSKNYDGTLFSPFTVSYYGFVGTDTQSLLTGTLVFSGSATTAINAGTGYVITPEGLSSDKYAITFVNGNLDINKAPLTITAENKSKTYDGTLYSPFTIQYYGFINSESDAVLTGTLGFSGSATSALGAGAAYVITPQGFTSNNYEITYVNGNLSINKAPLTITADNKAKMYDGTVYSPFTVNYYGFVSGDDYTMLGGEAVFGGSASTTTNVGINYVISPSGLTSNNYEITFVDGKLDITKAPLTITADNKTKKYDGTIYSPFTLKYDGFVSNDNFSTLGGTAIYSGSASTNTNVGTDYEIVPSGLTSVNYDINFVNGKLDITKAPLTITAEDKSKVFDGNVFTPFTAKYLGFISGEQPSVLGGTLTFTGNAITATNLGTGYVISPSGLTSDNYNITFVDGKLDIYQLGQTITFNSLSSKTYGDANFDLSATASSGLGITFSSTNTSVATISGNSVTIVGAGSANIIATQPGDVNYMSVSKSQLLIVNSKLLTISGVTAANKPYDGTTTATLSGGVLNGIINADDVTLISGTGNFDEASVGVDKTVTANGFALSGTAAFKYSLAGQPVGLKANIIDLGTKTVNQTFDAVSVFPTITFDKVQLKFNNAKAVELIGVTGQILKSENVENRNETFMSLSTYPHGIYLIKVKLIDGAQVVKRVLLK